jgi:hypothetical protein
VIVLKGIMVMKWNERSGAEIAIKYPESLDISEKTLMQVYAQHGYEETSGVVSLLAGPLNMLSYYTGEENGYYILVVLDADDESQPYEEALIDSSRLILTSIKQKTLPMIISGVFGRIENFPRFEIAQLLALLYQHDIKRAILKRLEKEGHVSKGELQVWLKEQFEQTTDFNSEFLGLVKYGLVKEGTVKGVTAEFLFLMKLLFISRIPPATIIAEAIARGMPESLAAGYKQECTTFFSTYVPSEADALKLCEVLVDPACYEVIKLLRMSVVTLETLEKLKKKGVTDVMETLRKLAEVNVVAGYKNESDHNRYFALKSDILCQRLFPEYLINVGRQSHNEKTKSSKVIAEHLRQLKDAYLESLKPVKEGVKQIS